MLVAIVSFFAKISAAKLTNARSATTLRNIFHFIDTRQCIPDGDMNNRVHSHEFKGSHFSVVQPGHGTRGMMDLTGFSNASGGLRSSEKENEKGRALRSGDDRDDESRIGRRVGAQSQSAARPREIPSRRAHPCRGGKWQARPGASTGACFYCARR